jgi:DNA-binding IclR family transcriptional regulator
MNRGKAGASSSAIGSLCRGLSVLCLVIDHGSLRADEIANELHLPLSSVYRYVRTLREFGLIVEDEGEYKPGHLVDATPWGGVTRVELVRVATPIMTQLAEATGETVCLVVRVNRYAMCIHQIQSTHHLRMGLPIGELLPLHAGATARTLLAFAPQEIVDEVLSGELEMFTSNTPDRAALTRKLESTRQTRVTTSRGEMSLGSVAIAVPILANGAVICALCVAGPDSRCNRAWQVGAKFHLCEAGKALGELVDGRAPRQLLASVEEKSQSPDPDAVSSHR